MNKNLLYICLFVILFLIISLLFHNKEFDEIKIYKITQYTNEDIMEVSSIAIKYMKDWKVDIIKIWYDEVESYEKVKEYKTINNDNDVIILYSNFKTTKSSSNAGFGVNKKYNNFTWIFVKNAHGKWELKGFGY